MKTLACLALLAVGLSTAQDPPPPAERRPEHEWLRQLVGDWRVSSEATMEPGGEPMRSEGSEQVRSFGDLWVVCEGTADFGGDPFRSMMTLGYDPDREAFVGTWIDTMQTHLWTYVGSLDEARRVLTLEAEGPSFGDPTKTALYRDVITIEGPDHKVLTSSIRGEDGAWTTFLRADHRRDR